MYPLPATRCPDYPYPLENYPACAAVCQRPSLAIYGQPAPAEMYGREKINPLFYYHDPQPFPLSALAVPQHHNPMHEYPPFGPQKI